MKRLFYFLLPDVAKVRSAVDELERNDIARNALHVIATKGTALEDLPPATHYQRNDPGTRLEKYFWDGNLVLFFIALVVPGVLILLNVSGYWLLLPAVVMLAAFLAGVRFSRYIPNVHLAEFDDALHHREILLMDDVHVGQVAGIEKLIHRQHPEAVTGGVGWHIDALQVWRQDCRVPGTTLMPAA